MKVAALIEKPSAHIILIALLGLLAYSNTFDVPFQWDEDEFIEKNAIVKDISYFFEPGKARGLENYGAFKSRFIGYLTFAFNYKLHGSAVAGYHVFNLSIHILNALLVYFLASLILQSPFLSGSFLARRFRHIALFTGLLFISHPVQTEAVTYIFQRLASLAAFFYIGSLVFYAKWRLTIERQGDKTAANPPAPFRACLYLLSLLFAVLAMKTKENAFTLPIVIMLYEFSFFSGSFKRRAAYLIPPLLALFIIPLTLTGLDKSAGEIIGSIGSETRGFQQISRQEYLITQSRVVVTYLRLLFLPLNQNLSYDYPIFDSFHNPRIYPSLLFILSIIALAFFLFYRSKVKTPELMPAAFGLFWFFITLAVESSIVPLPMIICEYRLYLPGIGIFLAVVTTGGLLAERTSKKTKTAMILFPLFVSLIFAAATHKRNGVWESKISLWEDTVKKSPGKAIGHFNLANHYRDEGNRADAAEHYLIALELNPAHVKAHINLAGVYSATGRFDDAIKHLRAALDMQPDNEDAHYNLGLVFLEINRPGEARSEFEKTLKINPQHREAKIFLNYVSGLR